MRRESRAGNSTAGGTVLNYYKEAPMFEESLMGSKGSRPGIHHGCWASVSMSEGRVIGVQFESRPRTEVASDHCEEIFIGCAPIAERGPLSKPLQRLHCSSGEGTHGASVSLTERKGNA